MIGDSSWQELAAGDSHCLSLPCQALHRAATNWGWLGEPRKKRPLYHVMHLPYPSAVLCRHFKCTTLDQEVVFTLRDSRVFWTFISAWSLLNFISSLVRHKVCSVLISLCLHFIAKTPLFGPFTKERFGQAMHSITEITEMLMAPETTTTTTTATPTNHSVLECVISKNHLCIAV